MLIKHKILGIIALGVSLSGCDWALLNPAGDIAVQQSELMIFATELMLLVVVPVTLLSALFAWHYRASNTKATYTPNWSHSTSLEIALWTLPLLIIVVLGVVTWKTTHSLDPFHPLTRLDATRPLPANVKPLKVQAVAMDWKWLFIYPEQGIATVNELAAPIDVPISFDITATSIMNALSIPAMAGMIVVVPGMQGQLHAVVNRVGTYQGLSGNYSGAGFSDMRFRFFGMTQKDFDEWVAKAKSGGTLGTAEYLALEKPSIREPVHRYSSVATGLYDAILNRCVAPGTKCKRDMMASELRGDSGLALSQPVCNTPPGAASAASSASPVLN